MRKIIENFIFLTAFLVVLWNMTALSIVEASDCESMDLKWKFEPWLWDKLQKLEMRLRIDIFHSSSAPIQQMANLKGKDELIYKVAEPKRN